MCLPGHVKLDEHPKLMALICTLTGIAGIGLILTIAFSDQDTMLGIGIGLGVLGVAGTILGCIHLTSASSVVDSKKYDGDRGLGGSGSGSGDLGPERNMGTHSIAPNKVPSPYDVSKGKIRGVDDDASPSPTRVPPETHNSPGADAIIDMSGANRGTATSNIRWGGGSSVANNSSSPARGVIPAGGTSMYSSSNGSSSNNNNGTSMLASSRQLPPGTIFSSTRDANNNNNQRGPSNSSNNNNNNDTMLSPFDKRSYPVPASLFPAPSPGANNNNNSRAIGGGATINMNPDRASNTSFQMDTGVHAGNGYDKKVANEQIRQNEDEMEAMRQYQENRQPVRFSRDRQHDEEDDEDALPKNYWAGKRN